MKFQQWLSLVPLMACHLFVINGEPVSSLMPMCFTRSQLVNDTRVYTSQDKTTYHFGLVMPYGIHLEQSSEKGDCPGRHLGHWSWSSTSPMTTRTVILTSNLIWDRNALIFSFERCLNSCSGLYNRYYNKALLLCDISQGKIPVHMQCYWYSYCCTYKDSIFQ